MLQISFNFQTVPYQIRKTTIALFLTELLNQVLKEEEQNEHLFEFIYESILFLDDKKNDYENFHLQFMLFLSKFLGIKPASAYTMLEEIGHVKKFNTQFTETIDFFLHSRYDEHMKLASVTRNEILMLILDYYRFHYDSIREFKSIQVLKEVLS